METNVKVEAAIQAVKEGHVDQYAVVVDAYQTFCEDTQA